MNWLWMKIAVLVAMTHGVRTLSRWVGPRRGALLLGLPCSTALVLVCTGNERGVVYTARMAESSLLGLVAAVALPMAYAQAVGLGGRLPQALAAAVGGYLAVAGGFSLLPDPGAIGGLLVATACLGAACRLADRIPNARRARGLIAPSRARTLALRTAVPVACLVLVTALHDLAGAHWAGLLSTFPGMTLAVLVVTHLEAGPAEAGRMAKSLPPGNLGMVAFLAAFRFGCPALGLAWGTALGYLLSATTLMAVGRLERRGWPIPATWARLVVAARSGYLEMDRERRPGPPKRLLPLVEPIGL